MNTTLFRLAGAAILACFALAAISMGSGARIAIGIVVCLPSFVLMVISRRQLGASFAVGPKAKALVTTGLYARIQHPLYLFLDFFLLGIIIAIGLPALILAWAALVIVQAIQTRREEKVLAAGFGAEYEAYKARTWL